MSEKELEQGGSAELTVPGPEVVSACTRDRLGFFRLRSVVVCVIA